MTKIIRVLEEKDRQNYNQVVTHPLQSWEWGDFRKSQGHQVIRFGILEGNKMFEAGQISFHHLPKSSFTVGYFPKGQMPDKQTIDFLTKIGKENKAIFIKLEPNIEQESKRVKEIKTLGLVPGKSLFTKYTSVIDLTRSENEIFDSFKSKTRYNVRLAEKHGIIVKENDSEEAFSEYLKLLFETTNRQGFYAHDKKFHQEQWQILKPSGISHLLSAKYQGKTLASFLLFVFNNVVYYPYGASTREHKELMAPNLLMWEAIKFGKKMGCQSFDLWGNIEPNPQPNNPYFGFHKFKEGFSPRLVEFIGTYDLVIDPVLYCAYKAIDKVRWGILRLKAKLL